MGAIIPQIVSGRMDVPKVRETILKEIHSKSWRYISRKHIKPPTGFGGFVRRGLRFAKRVAKKIFGGKA